MGTDLGINRCFAHTHFMSSLLASSTGWSSHFLTLECYYKSNNMEILISINGFNKPRHHKTYKAQFLL